MRVQWPSCVLGLAVVILGGCTEEESPGQGGGGTSTGPTGCPAGQLELADETCLPAGVQPSGCLAGELTLDDGSCQPAGIPADQCGTGFASDDDGGCEPILPAAPCAAGLMAVPGETECRPVAPCVADPYGEAPVDGQTIYVDGSYAGGDSDGTAAKPWTTIQAAIDGAPAGGLVAIAAGVYDEDLIIQDKAVRLWGKCPAEVEVAGVAEVGSVMTIGADASGTELHALAITGPGQGIEASVAELALDRVWIHDTGWRGVYAHRDGGPMSLTMTGSLVEGAVRLGLWLHGVEATLEGSVVRGTKADVNGDFGEGLFAELHAGSGTRTELTLRQSVVEGNRRVGLFVGGADALVESTVVRDNLPSPAGGLGRGVQVQDHHGVEADVTIRGSVLSGNHNAGVAVYASTARIESTVVGDTQPDGDQAGGYGVHVERAPATEQAGALTMESSLVVRNRGIGIGVEGGETVLEAVAVRDTDVSLTGDVGRGINVQSVTTDRALVTIRGCAVERSHETGIFLASVVATVEGTAVRDTQLDDVYLVGLGLTVTSGDTPTEERRAQAVIRSTTIEGSTAVGMSLLDADATLEGVAITATAAQPGPIYGDGLTVGAPALPASAVITGSRIAGSARAGVSCFGGNVSLSATELQCNTIQLDGEEYGGSPYGLHDLGNNACGCADLDEVCKVLSTNLAPPEGLPGQYEQ